LKEISWREWYDTYKDKKPLNEITCDYNLYCQQYDDYWRCLWLQGNHTNFILQENDDFLLQENGDKLIWLINE